MKPKIFKHGGEWICICQFGRPEVFVYSVLGSGSNPKRAYESFIDSKERDKELVDSFNEEVLRGDYYETIQRHN